jgi:hypothetical protein
MGIANVAYFWEMWHVTILNCVSRKNSLMYHVISLRVLHVASIDCRKLKRTRFVRSLVA